MAKVKTPPRPRRIRPGSAADEKAKEFIRNRAPASGKRPIRKPGGNKAAIAKIQAKLQAAIRKRPPNRTLISSLRSQLKRLKAGPKAV